MISKIVEKLRDASYRKAFVASQINIGISFQIRALMKARGWTQEKLAEKTGMLQPRISAILKPGRVRPNIETLRRIAEAFDCGLIVRFAPFGELARWSESFDPDTFNVPSFEQEPEFRQPEKAATAQSNALRILAGAGTAEEHLPFWMTLNELAGPGVSPASKTLSEAQMKIISIDSIPGFKHLDEPAPAVKYTNTNTIPLRRATG